MKLVRGTGDPTRLKTAVGAVLDPELGLSLGDLGMVKRVTPHRSGRVDVEVLLTSAECPLRQQLTTDVTRAVHSVAGDVAVDVELSVMSERQRQDLGAVFKARRKSVGVPSSTTVYAVASGKGGVGKSSVAANLAVSLARAGKAVGLLDADVWGYSVPQLFGVTTSPIALYETMLPVQAHGVRLMSLGFLVDPGTPIIWRGPMLHKALTQFVNDVHWGDIDVLLVDLPPGTGDVTLSVLELLPESSLLVVTTPHPAALTVARRVGVMAREGRMPISGVIENMTALVCPTCGDHTPVFGVGGGEQLAQDLAAPLLGRIPLDIALRDAGDRGIPVVAGAPTSASARAVGAIAAKLRPVRRSLVGRHLSLTPV